MYTDMEEKQFKENFVFANRCAEVFVIKSVRSKLLMKH